LNFHIDFGIVASLVVYLIFMITIGMYFYNKNNTPADYFLGNRKLGSWVTSMSAQASDMSGWLLMGLPGAVYASGLLEGWTAVGLAVGTYLNWLFIAKRLRQYTKVAGDAITLPQFFTNRFRDNTGLLRILPAVYILIFYAFYVGSGFLAGSKLFSMIFGMDTGLALFLTVLVIVAYTFAGGYLAVCWTDFFQGLLMFCAIIIVPCAAIASIGGFGLTMAKVAAFNPNILNPLTDLSGNFLPMITVVSCLSWGLGYVGQPHIIVRFMSIGKPSLIKKSRRIATVWVIFSLICAVLIGIVGRAFIPGDISSTANETLYITMVLDLFPGVIAGLLLAALLAAIMSTADSQLLVSSSAIASDLYKSLFHKEASGKAQTWIGRITVLVIALVAAFLAMNQANTIYALVAYAWAGLGATFGPTVIFSLYWKRMNLAGAIAGVFSGGAVAIIWRMFLKPLGGIFGLFEIIPAFLVSSALIVIVSLCTKAPSQEILDEFDRYTSCKD